MAYMRARWIFWWLNTDHGKSEAVGNDRQYPPSARCYAVTVLLGSSF